MDISKKRYYIYENISKIKNHNHIIDYLKLNNCKYTENKNGIFVNLNTIDHDIINHLHSMIYDSINNFIENDYITNFYEENNFNTDNKDKSNIIIKETININDIYLENFSEDEKLIINYSKTYF